MNLSLPAVSFRGGASATATSIKNAQERAELLCQIANETSLDEVHGSDVVRVNFKDQTVCRHTGIDNPPIYTISHTRESQGSNEQVFETFIRGENGNIHYTQSRELDGIDVSGVSYLLNEKSGILTSSTLTGRNFNTLPKNQKLEGLTASEELEVWNLCDSRS